MSNEASEPLFEVFEIEGKSFRIYDIDHGNEHGNPQVVKKGGIVSFFKTFYEEETKKLSIDNDPYFCMTPNNARLIFNQYVEIFEYLLTNHTIRLRLRLGLECSIGSGGTYVYNPVKQFVFFDRIAQCIKHSTSLKNIHLMIFDYSDLNLLRRTLRYVGDNPYCEIVTTIDIDTDTSCQGVTCLIPRLEAFFDSSRLFQHPESCISNMEIRIDRDFLPKQYPLLVFLLCQKVQKVAISFESLEKSHFEPIFCESFFRALRMRGISWTVQVDRRFREDGREALRSWATAFKDLLKSTNVERLLVSEAPKEFWKNLARILSSTSSHLHELQINPAVNFCEAFLLVLRGNRVKKIDLCGIPGSFSNEKKVLSTLVANGSIQCISIGLYSSSSLEYLLALLEKRKTELSVFVRPIDTDASSVLDFLTSFTRVNNGKVKLEYKDNGRIMTNISQDQLLRFRDIVRDDSRITEICLMDDSRIIDIAFASNIEREVIEAQSLVFLNKCGRDPRRKGAYDCWGAIKVFENIRRELPEDDIVGCDLEHEISELGLIYMLLREDPTIVSPQSRNHEEEQSIFSRPFKRLRLGDTSTASPCVIS